MPKTTKFGTKFRDNLKAEELKALINLRENGAKWKQVLKETGLSHSKAELAWMEHEAEGAGFAVEALNPAFVDYARNTLKIGWGPIMVWTQSSEGKVREAWKQATNLHSDGQRVGRGGRFKFDEPELYIGELKPTGTDIPKDHTLVREVAREDALSSRIMKLEPDQVKSVYEKYTGKKVTKGWTKAKLALEITKAMKAKGEGATAFANA